MEARKNSLVSVEGYLPINMQPLKDCRPKKQNQNQYIYSLLGPDDQYVVF